MDHGDAAGSAGFGSEQLSRLGGARAGAEAFDEDAAFRESSTSLQVSAPN